MKAAQLRTLSTASLVAKYKASATTHGRAFEAGQPGKANREFDRLASIRAELRARGAEAHPPLLELLDDPEPGVRYWSALFALEFAPPQAEKVLAQIASTPNSLLGFSAEGILRQWKEGNFKLR